MEPNKTKQTKPIAMSAFSRSPVSIIIPFHAQYEKLAELVRSILLFTRSNPYEICLVDDASPNKQFSLDIKSAPQVRVVRSETQLGFGGALELGFQHTQQPWVVFMHSDCRVEEPNWLVEMGRSLLELKDKNVRMVSARSNSGGDMLKAKKGEQGEDRILNTGFLPLYCAMCHRELFSKIGGFVKHYKWCGYEDEELAQRLKKYGFRQAVCGKSWVHHEGAATLRTMGTTEEIQAVLTANREQCIVDMKKLSLKR